jgi:hypothetical protein
LTLFLLLRSLVQKLGQILLLTANALGNLDNDSATLQLNLFALVKVGFALPMHVANEVAALIVDHDTLVEGVVFDAAIFPSLLLPPKIVREEADELEHGGAAPTAPRVQWPSRGHSRGKDGHRRENDGILVSSHCTGGFVPGD